MTPINPEGFPPPIAPYSAGTMADGVVYVAGILPFAADGNVVCLGDAAGQARHVLESIKAVVEAAGGTMADITFNHVFLTDWANYAAINAVYASYFPGDKPARYCVKVELVKPDCLVEIASVAHVGRG
ncbi:pyrimidine utilization protein C [Novosphingobium flavum]|uniref:Pyrimidine utilization protein C n=1 Tax=Novosphingobium flavum TaxID=1778672 RepID=A0A7X1KM06_9SPHN|nr:pyrimidine utilization protein C [Novosphingobium flavum]MBC2666131.1 pyrimidine utilization protein C [Novosphingobium flavum]